MQYFFVLIIHLNVNYLVAVLKIYHFFNIIKINTLSFKTANKRIFFFQFDMMIRTFEPLLRDSRGTVCDDLRSLNIIDRIHK